MNKQINAGEPLEYVRGFAEFLGVQVDLSKKPMIPRVETEYWVGKVLCDIKPGAKVLDIFCGSGCIGFAILKNVKNARVFFADKHKYFDNANFIKSDVFSNVHGKYDYIFANPPYIPTVNKHMVQKSVLNYEPHTALFAGEDGLLYIRNFLRQARAHLNPGGKIFMEFDSPQKQAIKRLADDYGYSTCKFHKDQFDRWRWVVIY